MLRSRTRRRTFLTSSFFLFPFSFPKYRVHDLLGGLAGDGLAALRAVRRRDGAVEDAQVVVDLGDGRDDGARVAGRRALLDGDCRGEALDPLDVGLLQAVEELARVGGERLDVASLALGVERVEGEGGLPAPREARDDGQGIAGDDDVDALQVVHLGVRDDDGVRRGDSAGRR